MNRDSRAFSGKRKAENEELTRDKIVRKCAETTKANSFFSMKTQTSVKNSVFSAIAFFGTLLSLSLAYAAWDGTMSTVISGNPLSAANWNAIVNNVNHLNDRSAVLSANSIRSNGGNANGSNNNLLTLNVDLTGKTGKWIHIYGGTAITETSNTANTSIIRLVIDNNAGQTTTVSAIRQGISAYSSVAWDGSSTASMATQGYFQIPAAYAVANATIKLNGGIDSGNFNWGDQSGYTNFDGENAGGYLGYAIY